MILADTSIWINFLNKGNKQFGQLLDEGKIAVHEAIIGELACGNIKNRNEILTLLFDLPSIKNVEFDEVLFLINNYSLHGKGIGIIDCYLLASSIIGNIKLWTADKKLNVISKQFGINYD